MLRIFLSLLLVFITIPAFAEKVITTQRPYYQPYYNAPVHRGLFRKNYNNSYFSDISALEKYALNKTYNRDSDLQRLQRLEMATFGSIQSGNIDSRYDNVSNAILSRPKENFKTSVLRNLGNYLSGQTTGFTPTIMNNQGYYGSNYNSGFSPTYGFNSNPFPSTFDSGRIVEYGGGPFNRGYRVNNYGTGSSTGVRILD